MGGAFLACVESELAKKKMMKKMQKKNGIWAWNGYGALWGWGWGNEETMTGLACAFQNQPICWNLAYSGALGDHPTKSPLCLLAPFPVM